MFIHLFYNTIIFIYRQKKNMDRNIRYICDHLYYLDGVRDKNRFKKTEICHTVI